MFFFISLIESISNVTLDTNSISFMSAIGSKSFAKCLSASNIVFDRKNEITNTDLFYKRNNNNDYFKYKAEQKKYLDYNYQMMINHSPIIQCS